MKTSPSPALKMQKRFSKDYSQVSCCLCLQPVSSDSRKRKNFHGSSCDGVRQTLARLSHCPLDALVLMSNPNAVICVVCHKKLVNVKTCEEKLVTLEGDVKNTLSSLTAVPSKRPILVLPADTDHQPSSPKQFRPAEHSLPVFQPPRVTLFTSHPSQQELSGAKHVSVKHMHCYTHTHVHTHTHTCTQEVSSTPGQSITSLVHESHQGQSSSTSNSCSVSLAQHPSTPQRRISAPSQGLSPSVRVSEC